MLSKTRDRILDAARAIGSLLPTPRRRTRTSPRVVVPMREDWERSHPTAGLTPARALALLHAADAGAPQQQFELFDDMLQKWPRLAAVEATRRLALTGLEWEVTPDEARGGGAPQRDAALRAADHCAAVLGRLDGLRDALNHLAHAIGHGIALVELVWERGQLVDLTPVPNGRLMTDAREPWRIRVRTDDSPQGVPIDAQPFKWLVHSPRPTPGRHFGTGLLRASGLLYLAQNLSFKEWLTFTQIAGMPLRVARFDPGTPEDDKRRLLNMLESLATDAVALVSKNVELEMIEPRGGEPPYQPLQQYCNSEITILWLGQHITTDIRQGGSRAAAEIHDRVREDLLADDIAQEGRSIRRGLLRPLVQARFGDGAATPHFRRSLIQSVDSRVLADTLAVAVRELNLSVPRRWVHRALGIPEPSVGEPVLSNGGES